ncbi:hypothetical protein ACHAQA_002926 [Verticillium albo-atrum]
MSFKLFASVTSLLLLATPAFGKTDLQGCTYSDSVFTPGHGTPYATRIWFVEDTGEICEFLDCGGGRAPPKTTVPGCGSYEGTDTYSPRFLAASTTVAPAESTPDVVSENPTTEAPTLEISTSASPDPQVPSTPVTDSSEQASTQAQVESSVAVESGATHVASTSGGSTATGSTTTIASATKSASESNTTAATEEASSTGTPNAANPKAAGGTRGLTGLFAGVALGAALL